MTKPAPPPEAVLLRLARKAAGLGTREAAAAAGISKARLSQIENGYERRMGQYKPVSGKDSTVAHLAAFADVTPAELDEAGRPDAAAVLRVILRRRKPDPPVPHTPPDPGIPGAPEPAGALSPPLRRILNDPDLSDEHKAAYLKLADRLARADGENGDKAASG